MMVGRIVMRFDGECRCKIPGMRRRIIHEGVFETSTKPVPTSKHIPGSESPTSVVVLATVPNPVA